MGCTDLSWDDANLFISKHVQKGQKIKITNYNLLSLTGGKSMESNNEIKSKEDKDWEIESKYRQSSMTYFQSIKPKENF